MLWLLSNMRLTSLCWIRDASWAAADALAGRMGI